MSKLQNDHSWGLVVEKAGVLVSKIFDWYGDDFGGKDHLIAFINRHRREPLPADSHPGFLDYRWVLNEAEDKLTDNWKP